MNMKFSNVVNAEKKRRNKQGNTGQFINTRFDDVAREVNK
jgi:hypothetical protein